VELYLIQHGITDYNLKRWSQGHADVPLNETGLRQANALAARLRDVPFHAIYSSDLARTRDSVLPLAKLQGLTVTEDWRLREGRWPHQKSPPGEEIPVLPFPREKESHEDVLQRVVKFLDDVLDRHPDGRVLIMTHGSVLTRLVFHLETRARWPFPPFQSLKMAINVIRREEEGFWEADSFNDFRHLEARDLLAGRVRRKRRHRLIVWNAGRLCRTMLPRPLHPPASRFLMRLVDRDRDLAVNPYENMPQQAPAN